MCAASSARRFACALRENETNLLVNLHAPSGGGFVLCSRRPAQRHGSRSRMGAPAPAPASWSSLPSHLLALLLAPLPAANLARAAAVCRAWRRAATADELWLPRLAALVLVPTETIAAMRREGSLGLISCYEACLVGRAMAAAGELRPWRLNADLYW